MKRIIQLIVFFIFSIISVFLHAQSREQRILLIFLGDIMAHNVNYRIPDYNVIYGSVKGILEKDTLTFANLETPVDSSCSYSTYPRFNVRPDYVQAAVEAGIEVFSLANNHAYDQEREGVFQTLRSLALVEKRTSRKIFYSGIRGNLKAPFKPAEIKRNGLRIGFLAVTQMLNVFQRDSYVHIVDYQNTRHKKVFSDYIRKISPEFDLFILSYHGGKEYAPEPDPEKVRFFHKLLDAGVDIVYAHHPHVLQPFKLIDLDGKKRLIIFSAGNFISGMTWGIDPADPEDPKACTGDSALWVVEVLFTNRQVSVERVNPILITNYKNKRGEMVVDTFLNLMSRNLPENWSRYYRKRYRIMSDLIRQWEKQCLY